MDPLHRALFSPKPLLLRLPLPEASRGPPTAGAVHFQGDAEFWVSPPPSVRVSSSWGDPGSPAQLALANAKIGKKN